jgi:hypothetical protein
MFNVTSSVLNEGGTMKCVLTISLLLLEVLPGCTKYQYAKNVKMISYEDNVMAGRSVGPVRGESCQARVMGYPISEPATLDKAVATAREEHKLRYLNNVSSEMTGFDAVFYGRTCILVKGTGYE